VSCRELADTGDVRALLVFDDATAYPVEFDLRGSVDDVRRRLSVVDADEEAPASEEHAAPRGPGRPRLGVVGREVTLLPRHWEWLSAQPGGASVALRRLVERARRENEATDRVRGAQEAALRFMSAIAGDEAGYEEAARALYAGDEARFAECTATWPTDIRDYAWTLAAPVFKPDDDAGS